MWPIVDISFHVSILDVRKNISEDNFAKGGRKSQSQ